MTIEMFFNLGLSFVNMLVIGVSAFFALKYFIRSMDDKYKELQKDLTALSVELSKQQMKHDKLLDNTTDLSKEVERISAILNLHIDLIKELRNDQSKD